jgi:hypothetical protein
MSCLSRAPDSGQVFYPQLHGAISGFAKRRSTKQNEVSDFFYKIINLTLDKTQKFVDMFSDRPEKALSVITVCRTFPFGGIEE